ncbi:MAG: ATP-binding protein [Clostridiales bacterium]|jgi:hypothetical protein|nr:ATP-binding protein [Clostridiales bacterium]
MDYILKKLCNNVNVSQTCGDLSGANKYTELFAEYVFRLFCALACDKHFDRANERLKKSALKSLFGKGFALAPSLGDYMKVTKDLTDDQVFKNVLYIASEGPLKLRNMDAHERTPAGQVSNYIASQKASLEAISKAGDYYLSMKDAGSEAYTHDFIIPVRKLESEDYRCIVINASGQMDSIDLKTAFLRRGGGDIQGMLYYRIQNKNTGDSDFFLLSPFIHYRGKYIDCDFTYYLRMVRPTFEGTILTDHKQLFPRDNELHTGEAKDGGTSVNFALVPASFAISRFSKITFDYGADYKYSWINGVLTNISQYPGHSGAVVEFMNSNYLTDICPQREELQAFCKDPGSVCYAIKGNAGLGKTVLALSMLSEIMREPLKHGETVYPYNRLIFLSAKTVSPRFNSAVSETAPDIVDYNGLLQKLHRLVVKHVPQDHSNTGAPVKPKAEDILDFINTSPNMTSTLLILDDLDSFSVEDQNSVRDFIRRITTRNLRMIITTRNLNESGEGVVLQSLDEEQSLKFVHWYLGKTPNYEDGVLKTRIDDRRSAMHQYCEGSPMWLEIWAEYAKNNENPEIPFKGKVTEKEKVKTMFSTTRRILETNTNARDMFNYLYAVDKALAADGKRPDIPEKLLNCLMPEISASDMKYARDTLINCRVLSPLDDKNKVYRLMFDFSVIFEGDPPSFNKLSQSIIADMESNPAMWDVDYYDRIVTCLIEHIKASDGAKLFDEASLLDHIYKNKDSITGRTLNRLRELEEQNEQNKEFSNLMRQADKLNEDYDLLESSANKVIGGKPLNIGSSEKTFSRGINKYKEQLERVLPELSENQIRIANEKHDELKRRYIKLFC